MKYYVEGEGRLYEIDLQEGDEFIHITLGDRQFTVDLREVNPPSLFSLIIDNRSHEVFVERQGDEYSVLLAGELFRLTVQDEWGRRLAGIQRQAQTDDGELAIKAPMPGMVIDVQVTVDQAVQRGQGLVILGAMKMENEIKSPRAGTVKAIHVVKGQTVEQGKTLVTLI